MASTTSARMVVALTSVASFMVALDLLVVSTALTTIRADLGSTLTHAQWVVTGYGLAFAGLLMAGAALGDRFGRRRMFLLGLGVFAIASTGCALAGSMEVLIATRVLQGVGAALLMPVAVTLLIAGTPAETRGRALGVLEGITGLATIAGPPVGGALAHVLGWEAIFWVNVPVAVLVMPLALRHVEESHGPETALDLPGMVLISAGALGLVWALVSGNDAGWREPQVVAALAAGVVLLAGFVGWQRRARAPMFPLSLFRSRTFSVGVAASVGLFGTLYASVFFLAQFMQHGLGCTALEAGLRLVPWTASLLVVAPIAGALADKVGDRRVLVAGLALNGVALAWIAVVAANDPEYGWLVAPLMLAGIGASMAIPVVQNVILGGVLESFLGKASGANNMTQELGGALGVALLVAVFTATGSYGTPRAFLDGFVPAMLVAAALVGVAAVAALLLPSRPPSQPEPGVRREVTGAS